MGMKAEDIRALNERCQKFAGESTISREQQDVGLKSIEVSMLTEIAAQLAEANESLKCIVHPPLFIENGKINLESFKDEQPRKITFMPSQDVKTLRDEFAMAALQGMLADPNVKLEGTAKLAYKVADEMLEARKK
jgi:hypothetical protein